MIGKITILNKKYDAAEIEYSNSITKKISGYDCIGKLFTDDLVEVDKKNCCKLIKSNIKQKKILGVLHLYSKYKYPQNKRGIERFYLNQYQTNFLIF